MQLNTTSVVRYPKNHIISPADSQIIVSYVKFDDSHSLLWVGDSRGFLTSYNGPKLQLYTSVKAHTGPILKILNHKKGILSLSFDSIRLGTREGVIIFNLKSDALKGLNSMSYTSNTQTELLVAGDKEATGSKIFRIDMINHCISNTIDYPHTVVFMETNLRYIVLGRSDGYVDILDPKSNTILKSFKSHASGLSHISVKDNSLLTTGFSLKKNQFIPDSFVNSFDLKSLTVSSPIPFPAGASKVFHHPIIPNVILISSSMGHMNFLDVKNPAKLNIYQADISTYVTAFDISSSGSFMAFVDALHNLNLWSRTASDAAADFALYNAPLTYPTPVTEVIPLKNQLTTQKSPFSLIKLPHFSDVLLSAWPNDLVFEVGELPEHIDPEILRSSEMVNGVLIARYDKEKFGARNVAEKYYNITQQNSKGINIPRFISEKDSDHDNDDYNDVQSINTSVNNEPGSGSSNNENVIDRADVKDKRLEQPLDEIFDLVSHNSDVPKAYKQLFIMYSKFGVDDFDFAFYNRTKYSGLEINSGNSFLNPILQLYRFVAPMFNYCLLSLAQDATREPNLLMELGYLYDMMNKSQGRHCATSNFQIIFSSIQEAQNLGLTGDLNISRDDYKQRRLIQTFNRFLLERLSHDECRLYQRDTPSSLNEICGVFTETTVYSNFCSLSHKRVMMYHSIDINSLPLPSLTPTSITILNYLEASMNKHIQQQIVCEKCGFQHPVNASLVIGNLPPIVVINLDLNNQQMNEIRYLSGWLVPTFYYAQSPLGTPVLSTSMVGGVASNQRRYELLGCTIQITNRQNESHLVTYSKIKTSSNDPGKWYLFNDFLVREVPESEVLDISPWWKKPVVMVYKEIGIGDEFKPKIYMNNLNTSILYKDQLIDGIREGKTIEYNLLNPDEIIKPGTLVALDAEFIELLPAEFEFNGDGSKTLVRPPKLCLARISVVRGDGEKEGECFIDDYIANFENVHDYKTAFSGIVAGDLTPGVSTKSLVTLQVAYRRIWLLLNLGCIFIGHWLGGDFRMINIYVPAEQVRDTGLCYYLKKEKRKLGLKFLAHRILNKEVQKGNHDSIEDSVNALELYKEYVKLKESGRLENTLFRLYHEGQMSRFKVPSSSASGSSTEVTLKKDNEDTKEDGV